MSKITLDTRIARGPELVSTDMDGETVMMSLQRGEYFGIGGAGSTAWKMLEAPVTVRAICTAVCAEFEVAESVCQTDMLEFVENLIRNGLATEC